MAILKNHNVCTVKETCNMFVPNGILGLTTSGIRPPSWNFLAKEASGEVGTYTSEKLVPKT